MSAPKTGMLVLIERLANGNTRRIPLEAAQAMVAAPGARYALVDMATNEAPKGVVLKRKGDMLVIDLGDQQVAQIDDFYRQPDAAFVPDASLGAGDSLSGTSVTAATPLQQGSSNVVWSAADHGGAGYQFDTATAGVALGGLALALAGAGGGGGGSNAAEPQVQSSRVIGTVMGGPITAGNGLTVIVYQADGVTKLGEGKVQADGTFSIDVGDYIGVVVARVVDANGGADHLDEATGKASDLTAQLFSMEVVREPNSTVIVNLNVLTTLAYHEAMAAADGAPLTAADVTSFNDAIATLFSLDSLQGTEVVAVNGGAFDGRDGYSQGEIYGALLAAFSGADLANGGDAQVTLEQVLAGLTITDGIATLSEAAQDGLLEGAKEAGVTLGGDFPGLIDTYAPDFAASKVTVSIDENSGAGQVVHTATASDPSTISYRLQGKDAARFSIDAATGEVTLTGQPNHEARASYSFTVLATDAAGNSSTQAVTVNVNDLDEVAPTITSGATARVDENVGAGQVIYTATADDSRDISGGVTYSLKEETVTVSMRMTEPQGPAFTIDARTGEVTLVGNPDFEYRSGYVFTVVATDAAGHSSEQVVTLNVNNLDEVAPTITSGSEAAAIDENSGAGQVVYAATSDDSADISGGVTYSLATNPVGRADPVLAIDATTGVVTLLVDPNFEGQSGYGFTVVATDAAGHSSEQFVLLNVNNLDEIAPTITSGSEATSIDENSGANQVVYTATSTDSADISGGVTYSLLSGPGPLVRGFVPATNFTIDAQTGAVTMLGNPDHEQQAYHSFTVVATDAAGNSSQQFVTLAINDLDEVPPTITSGSVATAIDENSGANQVVYTVTSDDTADTSGGVTYSLKSTVVFGFLPVIGDERYFSIDAATGAVTLAVDPDHESKSSYAFTVIATDAAGQATEQAVTLDINDLDEVAPTITSGGIATAIDENSGADQVVYTATSTDNGDISGGVTYSLQSATIPLRTLAPAAPFTIDATTGAVTLVGDPDHETRSSYSFTVVATDAAGLSTEQVVTLAVNDLDEVAPTITSGAVATAIDENSGDGQVVYTATADDRGDISGGVTFSLLPGTGPVARGLIAQPTFAIDAQTGAVTMTGNADWEQQASHSFTVVATDAAGRSNEQVVTLDVNNLDEVAPTITSGGIATAIDENSGAGRVVYTATSTDSGDISGGVTYSLQSAVIPFRVLAPIAPFTIDATTGAVTLVGDPDHETRSSYSFTVVATDAAGLSTEQVVTLAVNDLDEVAPTITSGAVATAIDENSGDGQVVYTATADDRGDISGGVTFSLLPGTGPVARGLIAQPTFAIDAQTGAVTMTGNADWEQQASHSFTVVATDAAGRSNEQVVTLDVINLDEVAPTITSGAQAAAIDENSGTGQLVYTATATDSGDTSSGVTYSLQDSGDAASFSIDAATGAVRLLGNPDHDTQASYAFTVVATDGAGFSDAQAVSLAVNADVTAPMITSMACSATGATNGYLNAGDTVTITVGMSEAVAVDITFGSPSLAVRVGGATVFASYAGGSGTDTLTFDYIVEAGDTDANGISLPPNPIALAGSSIRDAEGNNASLAYAATSDQSSLMVDTTAPTATGAAPADGTTAVAMDSNIVLNFGEAVRSAGGQSGITISNGDDVRSFGIDDPQVTIRGSEVTIDLDTDLQAGTTYSVQIAAGALLDRAGNAYAGLGEYGLDFTVVAPPSADVVFDLVEGVSSSHSGRAFQENVSYTIYVRVDSNSGMLSTDGDGPGEDDSWGNWTGGANLGTDDRIVLVGTGGSIDGRFGTIESLDAQGTYIAWQTAASLQAVEGSVALYRYTAHTTSLAGTIGNMDGRQLWTGEWAANPNADDTLDNVYLPEMPGGILTSQGLAGGGIPG